MADTALERVVIPLIQVKGSSDIEEAVDRLPPPSPWSLSPLWVARGASQIFPH